MRKLLFLAESIHGFGRLLWPLTLIDAMLYLAKAKIAFQKTKDYDVRIEKSLLTRNNLILDYEKSPLFGALCLLLASLCPILIARKVKKFASHMRLMKKVFQKIFALILIYANIITLFKNLLCYLLYKKSKIFQNDTGFLPGYSKTIAMMVGELEYENTFTDSHFFQEMVFVVFVVVMTIMLNNLLIGNCTKAHFS